MLSELSFHLLPGFIEQCVFKTFQDTNVVLILCKTSELMKLKRLMFSLYVQSELS